jgi:hypothetical protein
VSKQIQITVPEPCHENWDQMTPVDKGRFCGSCQKKVVDFTSMSDAEVAAFFKRPTTRSVCGRFMEDQLQRDLDIPKKRIPWVKYFFQFALPAFLISSKATAQGSPRVLTGDTIVYAPTPAIRGKGVVSQHVISGKIMNTDEDGIPNVFVSIDGTSESCMTDSAGNFKLTYSGYLKTVLVRASADSFDVKIKKVNLGKSPTSKRYLEMTLYRQENDIIVIAGMVAINRRKK